MYSLDQSLIFDPFDLEIDITPESVDKKLDEKDHSTAMMLAFRLNEQHLIQKVIEITPSSDIEYVAKSLPDIYVDKLLHFIGGQFEQTRHVEFYLLWCHKLMLLHGPKLKVRSQSIRSSLQTIQKNLTMRYQDLSKVCDSNKYSIQYLLSLSKLKAKRSHKEVEADEDSSNELVEADVSDSDDMEFLTNMSDD